MLRLRFRRTTEPADPTGKSHPAATNERKFNLNLIHLKYKM